MWKNINIYSKKQKFLTIPSTVRMQYNRHSCIWPEGNNLVFEHIQKTFIYKSFKSHTTSGMFIRSAYTYTW